MDDLDEKGSVTEKRIKRNVEGAKQRKKRHVCCGELFQKIRKASLRSVKVKLHGNKARKGCNGGSKPSQVNAKQKGRPIGCEFCKKNGGGNVADELARYKRNSKRCRLRKGAKCGLHGGDGRHVSRKDEEAKKCCEQSVVNLSIYSSIKGRKRK